MKRVNRLLAFALAVVLCAALATQLATPVSAASYSNPYMNRLVEFIETYGDYAEDGTVLIWRDTSDSLIYYFVLQNRYNGIYFGLLTASDESTRIDSNIEFLLRETSDYLDVDFVTAYYNGNVCKDAVITSKTIDKTKHTESSNYTVSGSGVYFTNDDIAETFNRKLDMLCTFWQAIIDINLGFGLRELGFTNYGSTASCDSHTYSNSCDSTCNNCGYTRSVTHTYRFQCSSECSVCGATRSAVHSWGLGTMTKEPTCAEAGVRTYTCRYCDSKKTEAIAKTDDHNWDDGVVTKQPTCVGTGVRTYTCIECDKTKTESVAATGQHAYGAWQTNGDEGHKRICSDCGVTSTDAHSFYEGICSACGEIEVTGDVTYRISTESDTVRQGDIVTVTVSSNAVRNVKSFNLSVNFDEEVFDYIDGSSHVSGSMLSGVDHVTGKANCYWANISTVDISGLLFTIQLKVKDTAKLGQTQLFGSSMQAQSPEGPLECNVIDEVLTVVDVVPGDVDGDGKKNTDDAVYLLLSVMFGPEDYPVSVGMSLDFDGNSKVNTDDAVYLLLHVMFGEGDYPLAA